MGRGRKEGKREGDIIHRDECKNREEREGAISAIHKFITNN